MNKITEIEGSINKIKIHSQQLKDEITTIKEDDISACFYLGNLKRLSLQALDLFSTMQKQVNFLNNQKRFLVVKDNMRQKRRAHVLV